MSTTNATVPALAFGSVQPALNILCYIYALLAATSLVTLFYLVKFIAFDETLSLGTKLTWRAVSNKFNVTLLIGEISIFGYYTFEAVHLYDEESGTSLYAVAAYICLANLQACLMWYTWLRGEAIFDIVLPGLPPFMKVMVPAATVFLYIPSAISVIAAFMDPNTTLKSIYRIMTAVSGLLLFLFDMIVCVSFSIYLRKATETVALLKSDQVRFRITCLYGLITSFFEGVAICGVGVYRDASRLTALAEDRDARAGAIRGVGRRVNAWPKMGPCLRLNKLCCGMLLAIQESCVRQAAALVGVMK
ncbi:hypothetical protein HDU78_007766 [Chytriomyces hyalinus]|nr:hypothetical protein HDU78_007766 [Chytriomyces hyalinus]